MTLGSILLIIGQPDGNRTHVRCFTNTLPFQFGTREEMEYQDLNLRSKADVVDRYTILQFWQYVTI
jgi:hypothetical protein